MIRGGRGIRTIAKVAAPGEGSRVEPGDEPDAKRRKVDADEASMDASKAAPAPEPPATTSSSGTTAGAGAGSTAQGNADEADGIDESLYSRQLYVMGHEAQKRMGGSTVLVVGMNGLGIEIAKNVTLAGVKKIVVHDDAEAKVADLGSQFYLTPEDVGKPRSEPSARRLAELNEYVRVEAHSGELLNKDFIKQFTVIVVADALQDTKLALNDMCRETGVCFISCAINGLFANAFCDFGEKFVVSDTNGEQPISCMISTIIQGNPAVVTVHDEARHGLEDGTLVRFSEIKGMEELNDHEPVPITSKGPYTFEIPVDTTKLTPFENGGYVHEVKQPKEISFKPMREALVRPGEFLLTDFAKLGRSELLHFAFQGLDKFRVAHDGAYPEPGNAEQCEEVVDHVKALVAAATEAKGSDADVLSLEDEDFDENARGIVVALASGACAELSPMAAFLGGVVGQEVLKACSGKFSPLNQWLYFDAVECLPDAASAPAPEDVRPLNSRYDGEIAVFGRPFVDKLRKMRMFLVGAGAIGCEMLKNWALMGVATDAANGGAIYITDMDKIERSNLNRQFLFRTKDVGSSKSTAAAGAAKLINDEMSIKAFEERVGTETENVFGDDFFASLDAVCTALDNVDARLYVDQRCLNYCKPMLESGTLGTKGNTQVVVPHLTENYGATRDPPEKSVPVCTLKNFPYKIDHTIQYARDWFEGAFAQLPRNANQYIADPDFVPRLDAQENTKVQTLEGLKSSLLTSRPSSFEDCITWAREQFEENYANQIKQLLHSFPPGMITSTGTPFWSGTKREPQPLEFSVDDPTHMAFIIAAANLRAQVYGLPECKDESVFRAHLPKVLVPPFRPKSIKIAANDRELKEQEESNKDMVDVSTAAESIVATLPKPADLADVKLNEIEFDKDNEENWHMDFITAASNLRARNYSIGEAGKYETKKIAGSIIPAIATTTALVTGLVCIELYKVVGGKNKVESYKNGFTNLALPFFAFSEPIEVKKTVAGSLKWSIWDKIEIDGSEKPLTLADFLRFFQEKYNVEVNMLSYAVSILHSFFSNAEKRAERMKMTMPELVESVTQKPIDPNQKYLQFEVICVDENDNDVDFPPVSYRLR
ncbi:Ubiquitin-like modifier-activating enzyme 1 [Hondaea fermentalgiana]|uniref:E1 ubiquitin-activating enzyme n=1 Tax=Hondaea fermentalgiana TaxID=2315210 RepID=A0A2R5GKP2_9STRA|nr:Ubiquitin-like modifier-activating enzyme 1 [Hondaea fermentalgiana]|eukprot:GBG30298.1 Ubiquitin-like modifier-activating enzyme 1 [Hondaea fermentalgiana]